MSEQDKPGDQGGPKPAGKARHSRSTARLEAVQALYQMDLAQTDLADVIEEFKSHRLEDNEAAGEAELETANPQHFAKVLKGVVRRQREIDPMVDEQLAEGWHLVRIDSIVRAILRAGTYELLDIADIPARVVISEYVEVAKAFFEGDEPRLVNGVLDQLARKLRPGQLADR